MPYKVYGKNYERKTKPKKYKRILATPPRPRPARRGGYALPEPEVVFSRRSKAIVVVLLLAVLTINIAQFSVESPAGMYFGSKQSSTHLYVIIAVIILLAIAVLVVIKTEPGRKNKKESK
jgi:hypothetical protein